MKKILLIFLLLPTLAFGETYYISNHGSNAYTGLSTTAEWLTLGYAVTQIGHGDTLLIMGGTWHENNNLGGDYNAPLIRPSESGDSLHPVVFKAYGTMPRLVPADSSRTSEFVCGVWITGRSWLVYDSLYIAKAGRGFDMYSSSHIVVKNCRIDSSGVQLASSPTGGATPREGHAYSFYNNTFFNCGTLSGNSDGAFNAMSCTLMTIYDNTIYGNMNLGGIFLKSHDNTLNEVYHNTIYGLCQGVTLSANQRRNLVYENTLYDCGIAILITNENSYANNWDSIYNNTSFNCPIGIEIRPTTAIDTPVIFNNLIVNSGSQFLLYGEEATGGINNAYINYNCFYNSDASFANRWYAGGTRTTYSSLSTWRAGTGFDANSINSYPVFADTANHDFHLTVSSPTAVKTGGLGGTYMGAYAPEDTVETPVTTKRIMIRR